jgi:prevent-host-death family protein
MLGVQEARAQFSARIDAAETDGEHTILLRRSRPAAVIVPAEWYQRVSALAGEPWEDWVPPDGS